MTFIEMVMLWETRGEKIVSDKVSSVQTDKFFYVRDAVGWEQRELPIQNVVVDRFPALESVLPQLPKVKKRK